MTDTDTSAESVDRFTPSGVNSGTFMYDDEYGFYVLFEDYQALSAERDALRAWVEEIVNASRSDAQDEAGRRSAPFNTREHIEEARNAALDDAIRVVNKREILSGPSAAEHIRTLKTTPTANTNNTEEE